MRLAAVLILIVLAYNGVRYVPLGKSKKNHKVVLHIIEGDSIAQINMVDEIKNLISVWDSPSIEIVCEGRGLRGVVTSSSQIRNSIEELTKAGVVFVACGISMKLNKIYKNDLLPNVLMVSSAEEELVDKQEAGWSYLSLVR